MPSPSQAAPPRRPPSKAKTAGSRKSPAKAAAPSLAAATAATAIEFRLFAPEAQEVCLAGDFSNWQPEKCLMRRFKDGTWKMKLKLTPGRYEYRFVVDGQWWTDPENPQRQENPFGQENSVLLVP
jgi:1,4-alpha-glucan branching enzyme